jgi:hypothetical protein
MNWNLVESMYGRSSIKIAHFVPICWQTWLPQAILVSDWSISKNLLFWNCLAKWTETWWEAPMEVSLLSFLKAEWKVSNTGSAHWASSFFSIFLFLFLWNISTAWYSFQENKVIFLLLYYCFECCYTRKMLVSKQPLNNSFLAAKFH